MVQPVFWCIGWNAVIIPRSADVADHCGTANSLTFRVNRRDENRKTIIVIAEWWWRVLDKTRSSGILHKITFTKWCKIHETRQDLPPRRVSRFIRPTHYQPTSLRMPERQKPGFAAMLRS